MKEILLSPLPLNEFEILVENSLRRVISEQTSTAPLTEIISRDELCKRLNITEPTAIRWERKGKIPSFRIGSSVRYNWHSVIETLEKKSGGIK
jgi:excisionase family DNA binding protein